MNLKKKNEREFKINLIYRGYHDLEINRIIRDALVSHDRNRTLHGSGKHKTQLPEYPTVSYKRRNNLSEMLTSSCTNNLQITYTHICKKGHDDDGFAAM